MIAHADFIEGLAKGLAVLESFDFERQRLNATLVSQRTGLTRAAARRQLLTLQHLGYVEGEGGQFWLSPKVLRLAGAYLSSSRLPRVLQPVLDRLALATQEACSAVVLDRAQVVIVARSLGAASATASSGRATLRADPGRLAYGLHQGARLAAHATSTGRMLLASLAPRDLSAWLRAHAPFARLTAHTVTEPKALRALLAQARRDDFCASSEAHELGVHAVAVPVRDLQGRVVAAINLVAAVPRAQPQVLHADLLPALRDAAREVQALL